MKRLLLVLILTFSSQTWTKADDIRDFEIEGMSIGSSLLDLFTKNEIEGIDPTVYPGSQIFHDIPIVSDKFTTYNQVTFGLKKNDNQYIIYSLAGDLYFPEDYESCLKKKKEIINSVSKLFSKQKRNDYKHVFKSIYDGKSFSEITDFDFLDKSSLRIYCTNWTLETEKKRNFMDMLSINSVSSEYLDWLNRKAY